MWEKMWKCLTLSMWMWEIQAQKEYKRHGNVAKKVYCDFCKKNGLEHIEKWYEHVPEGVVKNKKVKVLRDINVQCDNVIEPRRPDIIVIDKKEWKGIIIDINFAVPADVTVGEKEREKVKKIPGFEERDQKTVETQNGRDRTHSDGSPWKCHQRIWWVDWKARDTTPCWSNAKICLVGNCRCWKWEEIILLAFGH